MNSLLLVTGICLSTGLRLWGQTGADADDPTLAARLTELIGEASRDLELENAGTRDPIEVSAPLARLIVTLEEAWPKAKNLLPEIAPDDLTKSTVFRAAEELPIGMYLDALEIAMTLTENGAFNLAECLELLFPVGNGSFSRGNFLADNYQHPRIRSLLKRFRRVTESHAQINLPRTKSQGKADILNLLRRIESGEGYRDHKRTKRPVEAPPIAILNPAGDGLASRRIPEGTKLANALAIAQAEFKEKWERGLLTRDVYDAPIWSDLKTVLSRTPPVAPEEVSKAAPDWQRRWLLTQAAALLPIKEYLAIMEVFVVAFADDQVKARELSGYLHPMGPSGRYSLIEDNWNHPKIRSIRAKIAASEVKRLGLAPEVAAVLKEHLSSESPVQQDIPPHRKLNAAGDNFEEPPPKR